MEKISVTVKIPAVDGTYNFMVPDNMSVRDVQNLMLRILNSEYGISSNNSNVMLFDLNDKRALRLDCNFSQLGIVDGAALLLV